MEGHFILSSSVAYGHGVANINDNNVETNNEVNNKNKRRKRESLTPACNACRARKRKCGGVAPCSYCTYKKQPCIFPIQKKRGPQREQDISADSNFVSNVTHEQQMFDIVEAQHFLDNNFKFIKYSASSSSPENILHPKSIAHKVLSYSTLAVTAKLGGAGMNAERYIQQARLLSGKIFDSPTPDSILAFFMLGHYYQLVLNIPLARFYGHTASSLSQLTKLGGTLGMYSSVANIMCQQYSNPKERSEMVIREIRQYNQNVMYPFIIAATSIMRVFGFNILFPEESAVDRYLHLFENMTISEDDRNFITDSMNEVKTQSLHLSSTGDVLFYELLILMYQAITNWKSGHAQEGLTFARECLSTLKYLSESKQERIVSAFPHMCFLGILGQLFYDLGDLNSAIELCQFIKSVCFIMRPVYDFIVTKIDAFLSKINSSSLPLLSSSLSPLSSPVLSPLSPLSPLSSPLSPLSSPFISNLNNFELNPTNESLLFSDLDYFYTSNK